MTAKLSVSKTNEKFSESISCDEKSYLDWREKLTRGLKQLDAGEGVELEVFLKQNKEGR